MAQEEWEFFISHASEDKEEIALPIANRLKKIGYKVWLDELILKVGDRLSSKINEGLAHSKYGIVILSPNFLAKEWPQRELAALFAREDTGKKVILPIWHNIKLNHLKTEYPLLCDKVAVTSNMGIDNVVEKILDSAQINEPSQQKCSEKVLDTIVHGSIEYELVRIPGGTFTMGTPVEKTDRRHFEGPQHQVSVQEFYMGRYLVNQRQYWQFLQENPQTTESSSFQYQDKGPNHTAFGVKWNEAMAFADWAGLSLPSEAQWEYACRAGNNKGLDSLDSTVVSFDS